MPIIQGTNLSQGVHAPVFQRSLGTPAVDSTTAIHAAVTDTGVQVVVTTSITDPDDPRNITATAGGTTADIKAVQVIIAGTNAEDESISETLPVFTVNTANTVNGSKAFKTVSSITIPAHDGTGATTATGTGGLVGIGHRLARNTVLAAFLNDALESTAPTVATSATAIESNTCDLNSAWDGNEAHIIFVDTGAE